MQRFEFPAIAVASAVAGAVVVGLYRMALPDPVVSCRPGAAGLARLELLFGMSRKSGAEISDAEWTAFLDAEVTPRFPDGLTVLAGYGQWRSASGGLGKEKSRVLLILYKREVDSDSKIEAIRSAYKIRFGQESVLRVDGASCVSF